jgi:hypothetical protein
MPSPANPSGSPTVWGAACGARSAARAFSTASDVKFGAHVPVVISVTAAVISPVIVRRRRRREVSPASSASSAVVTAPVMTVAGLVSARDFPTASNIESKSVHVLAGRLILPPYVVYELGRVDPPTAG